MPILMKKEQYRAFFNEANKNKDGYLTFKELCEMLKSYSYPVHADRLMLQFQLADADGDNKLTFDEFLAAMEFKEVNKTEEKRLRRVFDIFDKDKSNEITVVELQKAIKQLLNKSITTSEAEKMIKSVDADQSGTIGFNEFVSIMRDFF